MSLLLAFVESLATPEQIVLPLRQERDISPWRAIESGPGRHVFSNRSVKQRQDILTNKLAANTHVIVRKTQIGQCAAVTNWGDTWNIIRWWAIMFELFSNVSYILFINPRALFCHCQPYQITFY